MHEFMNYDLKWVFFLVAKYYIIINNIFSSKCSISIELNGVFPKDGQY